MVLESLSSSLKGVVARVSRASRVNKQLIEETTKEVQRALLRADVNVRLVMQISSKIRERALKEKTKINRKAHVIRILYDELVKIMGTSYEIPLEEQTIMLVGLQGCGKTLTAAKLARYFQKRGMKAAVICSDTYRPGAYDQLEQICKSIHVPFHGGDGNAIDIAKTGTSLFKDAIKIIDTAGRHSLEADLIKEMKEINNEVKPDHKILVLDAAIGQQASEQARAFDEAIGLTGVIITKLDGTAKGGGALSAVSQTGSPITFIGAGESADDLEKFEPEGFMSRLLGMGDIKSLSEIAEERLDEKELKKTFRGKFTLHDMYEQLRSVEKLGPLKQTLSMIPFPPEIDTNDLYDITRDKLKQYKVIMDSMTEEELQNPKVMSGSRIRRVANGAGVRSENIKEMLNHHKMLQKIMKDVRGDKIPRKKLMKMFKI